MSRSRREFVKSASAAAAFGLLAGRGVGAAPWELVPVPSPRGSTPGDPAFRELALYALDVAKSAGASYADVRIDDGMVRQTSVWQLDVVGVEAKGHRLLGVRVIADGAWGFASTVDLTREEVSRVARQAVARAKASAPGMTTPVTLVPAPPMANGEYATPIRRDPFAVPVGETLDLSLAASEAVSKAGGALNASAYIILLFQRTVVSFASTEGAWIVQTLYKAGMDEIFVDASENGNWARRDLETCYPRSAGYEALEDLHLTESLPRLVDDVRQILAGTEVDVGRYDVVLDGYSITEPLMASIISATELDRALGYDQDGGTSYLRPPAQVLGSYQVGSPQLTIRADGGQPGGWATVGWDAEGVKPETFPLVDKGVLVDFLTDRALAPELSAWYAHQGQPTRSHGCAYAEDASFAPSICWPSIVLEPATGNVTVEEMIAATKRGLFVSKGMRSSVDPPLLNGMYMPSGMVYEIVNGKLGRVVKHSALVSRTPNFWRSLDMVGGPSTVVRSGVMSAKVEAGHVFFTTVHAPAVRIKQVNVANTYRPLGSA